MGAAASGVIIGIIRIVTKGSLPQTAAGLRTSTQIYFAASASITAVCLVLYELLMPRLDVIQHYRGKLQGEGELSKPCAVHPGCLTAALLLTCDATKQFQLGCFCNPGLL
jgi:hypothetical protein